jgi:serine protease DegS
VDDAGAGVSAIAVRNASLSVLSITTVSRQGHRGWTRVGTGFLCDNGLVLTRLSVVESSDSIRIALVDGRTVSVRFLVRDADGNAALYLRPVEGLHPIPVGQSARVKPGHPLVILGNSLGVFPSVTMGRLLGRTKGGLMRIGGVIPPGNCGSPVLDRDGRLVGMIAGRVEAKRHPDPMVGIAVPAERLVPLLDAGLRLVNRDQGWIGLSVLDLPGGRQDAGVRVVDVTKGGPADEAQVMPGDTIVRFLDRPVQNAAQLAEAVRQAGPESDCKFSIRRNGNEIVRSVRIGRRPDSSP